MEISFKIFLLISVCYVGVNSECPLGWVHYNDQCFHFSSDKLDWFAAESSCHFHNAKLAEPLDQDTTDYLLQLSHKTTKGGQYWIGGRDDVVEGLWQWSSSDEVISYTPWWPNNPDNNNGNEDCMAIRCEPSKCLYNDNDCMFKAPYICEKSFPGTGSEIIG